MNANKSNRTVRASKTSSQDAHDRWHELLSPSQVLVEPLNSNNNTRKKKCRGNRKLIKFRRRCRAKGMNNETIEILLASKDSNKQIQYQNQETMKPNTNSTLEDINNNNNISIVKFIEKQNSSTQGETGENQLRNNFRIELASLLEELAQKKGISKSMMETSKSKGIKYNRSSTDHWKQTSKLLPNYNKLSHHQFMDLLSASLPMYGNQIYQFLTSTNMFHFIQQHATLLCTYFQLKIEEDYWNYLANLSGMPLFNSLLQLSKDFMLQNSMSWDHTKTKTRIKDRQKLIANKLEKVEIDLNVHLQQYSSSLIIENTTYFEHLIKITFMAIAIAIRNDLQLFYKNFEQMKIRLHFDIKDAYYVKLFYAFNPTQEQIRSIQQIWRTKLKLCKRAVVNKKKHRLVYNENNEKNAHHVDNYYQQNQLPSIDSYPSAIRSIIKARLDNIEQRAQEIIKCIDDESP